MKVIKITKVTIGWILDTCDELEDVDVQILRENRNKKVDTTLIEEDIRDINNGTSGRADFAARIPGFGVVQCIIKDAKMRRL